MKDYTYEEYEIGDIVVSKSTKNVSLIVMDKQIIEGVELILCQPYPTNTITESISYQAFELLNKSRQSDYHVG